jgi:PII-like signaling protein
VKIVTIARIYIKEGDKIESHNLMREIFKLLHDQHKVHGVTVFRGVAGFGSRGEVHADDLLRLTVHLPLVLEFYDDPEVVASLLSRLQQMVPAGHIVSWTAQCDCSSQGQ